jgi:hypothetical protein
MRCRYSQAPNPLTGFQIGETKMTRVKKLFCLQIDNRIRAGIEPALECGPLCLQVFAFTALTSVQKSINDLLSFGLTQID